MTPYSRSKLVEFLNVYQSVLNPKIRVGDFGGAFFEEDTKLALATGGITDYHVLDYETGVDLDKPVKGKKYELGLCMDLLEHCTHPWLVAKNIGDALLPGAYLFVTAPFSWERHNYPGDYFRYTEYGLKCLFENLLYIEGGMGRDLQYKENSQIPDELFARIRAFAVFRKPFKGEKKAKKVIGNPNKIGYNDHPNYMTPV